MVPAIRRTDLARAVALVAAALAFSLADVDRGIAWSWAYDPALQGFPARGAFWATTLMHEGGRMLVWAVGLAPLGCLVASAWPRRFPRLAASRDRCVTAVLGIALTTLTIGTLKRLTHLDCPWDLAGFGGTAPYVGLFDAHLAVVTAGGCFPAAHAGSGFALLSLYFAWRDTRWAKALACAALLVGGSFGIAQQARGAHFASHDLWSLAIAWSICMLVAATVRRARMVRAPRASHDHDHDALPAVVTATRHARNAAG